MGKQGDTTKAKRQEGALIHVRAPALYSKNNKSVLNCIHGTKHASKKINGKVVCAE